MNFNDLREKYSTIIYHSYEIEELEESYKIIFNFEIVGLTSFKPSYVISKKYIK